MPDTRAEIKLRGRAKFTKFTEFRESRAAASGGQEGGYARVEAGSGVTGQDSANNLQHCN
jgi:hypothetical protein